MRPFRAGLASGHGRLLAPSLASRPRLTRWPCSVHQATSGICYRTLQYADSQVNKLEITPDKHYLAGASAQRASLAPQPYSASRALLANAARPYSGGQPRHPAV